MADRPTVLVTETLADAPARWLEQRVNLVWVGLDDEPALREHLQTADGLLVRTYTQVDDALLDQAPRLKVVGRAGVGLDNIDLDACQQRHIPVVYTPDANTQAVVEYVIGLMLDDYRPRTDFHDEPISAERFHALRKSEVGRQLDHSTLGILGFGRIGKSLGRVAHAIGMNLKVCDLLPEAQLRKAVDYPFDFVNHSELYSRCDILSIHVDGRASNRHLIDRTALSLLQPHCLFINAARGMLVDHDALADWLRANPAGRAILDVHDPEPPPADYPLYGLPNARLLPHLASRTDQALENMSWVVRDVWAVLDGRAPHAPAR
ncbi:MAG: NAD(P)-dependent oxidoreductase [Phycisphaeraceae bacterium]